MKDGWNVYVWKEGKEEPIMVCKNVSYERAHTQYCSYADDPRYDDVEMIPVEVDDFVKEIEA